MKRTQPIPFLMILMMATCIWPFWLTGAGAEIAALQVAGVTPCQEGHWFDLDEFPQAVVSEMGTDTHYFLSVCFEDPGQRVQMTDAAWELISQSGVYAEGGTRTSMIDDEVVAFAQNLTDGDLQGFVDSYILVKDAGTGETTLNIPVKPFLSQTAYQVEIPAGIVADANQTVNASIVWRIEMMAVPVVSAVSPGTVGENYDDDEPITIRGDYFNPAGDIVVKFNKIRARKVKLRENAGGDGSYLEVFLPRNLDPGLYDITVINSLHCKQTVPACFSVVREGDWNFPADGQRLTSTVKGSELYTTTQRSENTLLVNGASINNDDDLHLNLDQEIGASVLVRRVTLDELTRESHLTVKTDSIWGEVDFYGLRKGPGSEQPGISIGRVESLLKGRLTGQLRPLQILSEPIEIVLNNCAVNRMDLQIPYRPTSNPNLTVLHYEPAQWLWTEETAVIDPVNRSARITTTTPGVFVVVQ